MLKYFGAQMVPATLYRYALGDYAADGSWTPGARTSEPIRILAPQPASGEVLNLIPEGESVSDFVTSATEASVSIRTRAAGRDPDEIEVGGTLYECAMVGRWGFYGGFDRIILKKKGV